MSWHAAACGFSLRTQYVQQVNSVTGRSSQKHLVRNRSEDYKHIAHCTEQQTILPCEQAGCTARQSRIAHPAWEECEGQKCPSHSSPERLPLLCGVFGGEAANTPQSKKHKTNHFIGIIEAVYDDFSDTTVTAQ
jgi:hypothetical protein